MEASPPVLSLGELILRIAVAGALGGLVGLEREFSDQPAGFRTHILVSFGAALFTMAGAYGVSEFFEDGGAAIRYDPTRIAAQVVTGIGFLGAGAILRQGVTVRGLTTAASLWVTAAIGLAVGLGYIEGALAVSIGALVVLYLLKQIGRLVFPRLKRGSVRMRIEMAPEMRLSDLAEKIEAHGATVEGLKIASEGDERHLAARLHLPVGGSADVLADEISVVPGVVSVDWQP